MNARTQRLVLLALVFVAWSGCPHPRSQGQAEADRDLAAGKLCLRTHGYPEPWAERYHGLARERLGVEMVVVAGCVVSQGLFERTARYNEVMVREIDRRHGADALDELAEAARRSTN